MDQLLSELLSKTIDTKNYLKKSEIEKLPYLRDFIEVYETYCENFPSATENWLRDKMLLNANKFEEKQFIQFACEATVVKYFADRYKTNLAIEEKINPGNNKDVDLRFTHDNINFNIEIKCSDFRHKEIIDNKNSLKIQTLGRLEGLKKVLEDLLPVLQTVAERMNLEGVDLAKNMDNNLKDFLKSANEKFNSDSNENDLNVLFVCCNNAEDIQLWYYYMFKDQGLFTQDSFCPHSEYQNVDLVVLSNLYFKHNEFYTKKLKNSWDFGNSFTLIFENPFSVRKKDAAINKFLEICPNSNRIFKEWNMPGQAEEEVKDSRKIADFIKDKLENQQGIYFFIQP